jgi:chlorobactene glucosyltransferase
MIYLFYGIHITLTIILIVTVVNAITAPMVKKGPAPTSRPLVSVLIPARNEAHNIGTALTALVEQTYENLEIIVLDDHSTDTTDKVVESFQQKDARIQMIKGQDLPVGWTGKNWACFQLSQVATGDYFIFTDADNFYSADAVEKTIGWMQKLKLSLFSAFPQQITKTFGEKLVVPVFDTFVYSLLPLWLTYYIKFPSLAAANGQWIAFTREAYERIGGHASVKNQIVEDTELARLAKKKGEKVITAAGRDAVMGRMYSSWREVYQGFSKNAFGLMGYKTVPFLLFELTFFAVFILPWFVIWHEPLRVAAASAIVRGSVIRLIMALKYKQPIFVSTLLNPISIGATLLIGMNSFYRYVRGSIQWKDREIVFKQHVS